MSAEPNTVACKHCGALNEAEFGACIRCGKKLEDALPAHHARRRVPARRRKNAATGPGAEPFLGRFPATDLPGAKILLAMNLVIFTSQITTAMQLGAGVGQALMMGGTSADALRYGAIPLGSELIFVEPWRLLSACFIHFGILHLGMNMLGLLDIARLLEPAVGTVRFLIGYVVTGIVGFAVSAGYSLVMLERAPTAGASGAIFGILGMVFGFLWRRRDPRWKPWLVRTLFYSLVLGLMLPINNAAHFGGLAAGGVIGALFSPGAPQPSRAWQRVLAYLCLLACAGSLVAARFSPLYQKAVDWAVEQHLEVD
ncbi:MAG: rhomboid family intramembrane serine protease [Polyangiaceae bacterium]